MLADPSTYEILRPEDFGLSREISIGHRLTGWNTIRERARTLGLGLSDDTIREVTKNIKHLADTKPLTLPEIDALLQEAEAKDLLAAMEAGK